MATVTLPQTRQIIESPDLSFVRCVDYTDKIMKAFKAALSCLQTFALRTSSVLSSVKDGLGYIKVVSFIPDLYTAYTGIQSVYDSALIRDVRGVVQSTLKTALGSLSASGTAIGIAESILKVVENPAFVTLGLVSFVFANVILGVRVIYCSIKSYDLGKFLYRISPIFDLKLQDQKINEMAHSLIGDSSKQLAKLANLPQDEQRNYHERKIAHLIRVTTKNVAKELEETVQKVGATADEVLKKLEDCYVVAQRKLMATVISIGCSLGIIAMISLLFASVVNPIVPTAFLFVFAAVKVVTMIYEDFFLEDDLPSHQVDDDLDSIQV